MFFDPENRIIQLCNAGMLAEANPKEAKALFQQAWDESTNPFEKMIAAHYLARQQENPEAILLWNTESLTQALMVEQKEELMGFFPSLHLNIGKSLEDLNRKEEASRHYQLAEQYISYLQDDGYGSMIKKGIQAALERIVSNN
jgi:hypothetical protein